MFLSNSLRQAVVLALVISQSLVLGFTSTINDARHATTIQTCERLSTQLQGSVSKWNEEYQSGEDNEDDELITREMFLRDGLEARR